MREMHYLPVLGLGTYYTNRGIERNGDVPGAHELRQWAFQAKDTGSTGEVVVHHPSSQDPARYVLKSAANAWWYAAAVGRHLIPESFEGLDFPSDQTILVPVPASCTTRATAAQRWPALGMARALEAAGIGRVVQSVFFKESREQSHSRSSRDSADELLDALDVDRSQFSSPILHHVIYLDDLLTWGKHMAAVHEALGRPKNAMGFTIGCTDSSRVANALAPRLRMVSYKTLDNIEVIDVAG